MESAEREGFGEIEPHPLFHGGFIADGEILAQNQLQVPAPLGNQKTAVDEGTEEDFVPKELLDLLPNRIAGFGAIKDAVGNRPQDQGEGALNFLVFEF